VKYNSYYYVAKPTAGNGFAGVTPTNTAYWEPFGAQFESVATNLLLAINANVGGWVFRNNRLESQNGAIFLDGVNGKVSLDGGIQSSFGGLITSLDDSSSGLSIRIKDSSPLRRPALFRASNPATDTYEGTVNLVRYIGATKQSEATLLSNSLEIGNTGTSVAKIRMSCATGTGCE
jgi:hypothetical protein